MHREPINLAVARRRVRRRHDPFVFFPSSRSFEPGGGGSRGRTAAAGRTSLRPFQRSEVGQSEALDVFDTPLAMPPAVKVLEGGYHLRIAPLVGPGVFFQAFLDRHADHVRPKNEHREVRLQQSAYRWTAAQVMDKEDLGIEDDVVLIGQRAIAPVFLIFVHRPKEKQ